MLLLGYVELIVFTDDYFHSESETPIVQALTRLTPYYEITWTLYYQDPDGFAQALETSPAHMAIVDNNCFHSMAQHFDELYTWAQEKPLIIAEFNVDTAPSHPLWGLAGAGWRGDVREDTLVYLPETGIFHWPEEVPDTLKLFHLYEDRGDSLRAFSGTPIALFEEGTAAVMGSDCRVTVLGFLPAEAGADLDLDGVPDGVEFYEDLIWYAMDCNGLLVHESPAEGIELRQEGLELLANSPEPAELLLYSAAGRLVLKKRISGTERVSLRGLAKGVYIARLGPKTLKALVR